MQRPSGAPVALYGMEAADVLRDLEAGGVDFALVRADDPRGRREGADVVLAARERAGILELVVGSTFAWPEAGA